MYNAASSKEGREQLKLCVYIPSLCLCVWRGGGGEAEARIRMGGKVADGDRARWLLTWGHLGNEPSCVTVLEREVEKYIWVYVGISPLVKLSKYRQS